MGGLLFSAFALLRGWNNYFIKSKIAENASLFCEFLLHVFYSILTFNPTTTFLTTYETLLFPPQPYRLVFVCMYFTKWFAHRQPEFRRWNWNNKNLIFLSTRISFRILCSTPGIQFPMLCFTPYVKGKFKWNTTRELVFSPSVGFRPSTDYKTKLSDHLLRYTHEIQNWSG